jgi:hypothetical protein
MAEKLTKAQMTLLAHIEKTGIVYPLGANKRVANTLDDMGLVSVASVRAIAGYKITPAGRAVLSGE